MHHDFWRLMDELKRRRIPFTIMGNPFHLTDKVCERLRESGCVRYQLSLDGTRATHDWFRKPGSYDETLARIPMLKRHGIRAIAMTTVSSVNADELGDVIDASVAAGADVFSFARYVPTEGETDNGLAPLHYRAVLDAAHKKFVQHEKAGCPTFFDRKDHLWRLHEWEEGLWSIPEDAKSGVMYEGCNCGNAHLSILPNGDVFACRRVGNSKVGNVFHARLADLWLGPTERFRQFDRFSKCSNCELLRWCRGCPAVAFGSTGNFYAADPQCWHDVSHHSPDTQKEQQ